MAPGDIWPGFWLSQWGGRATEISMLLNMSQGRRATEILRPGMLLNMSQGTGEPPPPRTIQPQASVLPRLTTPRLEETTGEQPHDPR